ncbi:MAG TPA: lysylphosphatidylglycerol synthase transmembrane domain-containing protein [Saprospiraceae bacterium]|nr:lysylphosphatidylglycerol synthase transmembrane domain-containing protein [Saprospiraceae bacterium]
MGDSPWGELPIFICISTGRIFAAFFQYTIFMAFSTAYQAVVEKISLNKQLINNLFKVLVLLLPAIVLYYELAGKDNLADIASTFLKQLHNAHGWWLAGAVLLVPVNWLAEVQKWQPFVARYEPMSQWKALKAVLAGSSFALFTPNRLGEYGGRILFVRPENQWKALIANGVGSLSQYLVLLAGGVFGGVWFAGNMLEWSGQRLMYALILAFMPLCVLFYFNFNIRLFIPLLSRIPLLKRWESLFREIHFLEKIDRRELAYVLVWSIFRYIVYSTQYVLLLQFFEINTTISAGYAGVATIYLLQTVVPLPALAGLLVRGSLAVFVWSHFGANEICSLAATFVLWIINLILPALLGTFSLYSVNITKSLGYDDD